jgi:hypothetical protein
LIWTDHGEERPNIDTGGGSNSSGLVHNRQRKRIQLSQESMGSCSRGLVYDTANLSATLQHESISLTQKETAHNTLIVAREANERARKLQNDFDCFRSEVI